QQQVVVVEDGIALQNRHRQPAGVAQGLRRVVGMVDVPPQERSPANAVVALAGARLFEMPAEGVGKPEGGEVGFALDFGFRIARGVADEGGAGVNAPAPVRRLTEHTKAEPRLRRARHRRIPPTAPPEGSAPLGFGGVLLLPSGGVRLASTGGLLFG